MNNNHMYTKEEIKTIIKLWNDHSMKEICEELKLSPIQVGYVVTLLRKEGVEMPKKHLTGTTRSLIKEVALELK